MSQDDIDRLSGRLLRERSELRRKTATVKEQMLHLSTSLSTAGERLREQAETGLNHHLCAPAFQNEYLKEWDFSRIIALIEEYRESQKALEAIEQRLASMGF